MKSRMQFGAALLCVGLAVAFIQELTKISFAAPPTTRRYYTIPTTVNVTPINITGTGQQELIAAQSGKPICIIGGELFCSVASTMKFQSGNNDLTGSSSMLTWAKDPPERGQSTEAVPWKTTNNSEAFNVVLGTNMTLSGELIWFSPTAAQQ